MELGVVIPTASRMNKEAMKQRLRAAIAATHGSWLSAFVARTAQAYLNAYNNLCIWDVELNGELAAFKRIVRQTDGVVIDAGANIGQWANATKPYLDGKHLHCFEPIPDVFAKLCANVPEPHVTKNNLGLGRELKTIELNYSPTLSSISSSFPLIHPRKDDRPVQCRITTGDAYLTEKGIERVSFLKIDVEGMEMDVLSGFAKALGEGRIGAVQFEHGPSHIHSGHSLKSFVDFFRPFGYSVYKIMPKRLIALEHDAINETFAGSNYLAFRTKTMGRPVSQRNGHAVLSGVWVQSPTA